MLANDYLKHTYSYEGKQHACHRDTWTDRQTDRDTGSIRNLNFSYLKERERERESEREI